MHVPEGMKGMESGVVKIVIIVAGTVAVAAFACVGDPDANESVTASETAPALPGCDGRSAVSTYVAGHQHAVCVAQADLVTPRQGGATYTTTTVNGHDHDVSLSQAQLEQIAAGQKVDLTTSMVTGHTHQFSIGGDSIPTLIPAPSGAGVF